MASGDVWILSINTKMMDVPNGQTVVQNVKSGTVVKESSRQDDPMTGWWIQPQSPYSGWFLGIRHTEKEIEKYLESQAAAGNATVDSSTAVESKTDPDTVIDADKMNNAQTAGLLDTTTITYNLADSDFIDIKHVAGVFGLPYQFLPVRECPHFQQGHRDQLRDRKYV